MLYHLVFTSGKALRLEMLVEECRKLKPYLGFTEQFLDSVWPSILMEAFCPLIQSVVFPSLYVTPDAEGIRWRYNLFPGTVRKAISTFS